MSAVDNYDIDDRRYRSDRSERSHRHRGDRRDEPRYVETQETYVRSPVAPDPPYAVRQTTTDVIRRPVREDSDMSVEEVRRDFPPPGAAAYQQRSLGRDDRYGPVRSRSAERGAQYGAYGGDPRRSYNDLDDRRSRKSGLYVEQDIKKEGRRRSLSRNEKIITAVAGAALAVGGKELWDRRQADGRPVTRNPLQSAGIAAAGAFAGYEGADLYNKKVAGKSEEKVKTYVAHRGRNGEITEAYYSSEEEEKPKKISRRKSFVDQALALTGLGAAAKAVGGSRSRRGSDESRDTRARSHGGKSDRDRSPEGAAKYQQAAKAALLAGATEAFRVRNEPGGLAGNSKRILTAAIGAGGIDGIANKDRDPEKHSKRHILEAVVGGLAANYAVNGSRKDIEDQDGNTARSRSRSRSRSKGPGGGSSGGPLAALATAGLGAFAAKKLTDRSRSRSRAADTRRRSSRDSYDSRSPSPRGDRNKRSRSRSVVDRARKGLAAIGIGSAAGAAAADHHDRDRSADYDDSRSVRKSHRSDRDRSRSRGPDDGYGSRSTRDAGYADRGDPHGDSRHADSRSSNGGGRSTRAKDGRRNRRIAEGKQSASDSDSDLGSSTDDEKRIKKMKGKQLLTAGLATVATIHAAHNVYQSMEKRHARHKAVQEGTMTPEEARKLKAKATLQDAASIGIATLGIKGAISEIKEANEMRHECKEFREKKDERHNKRLQRQKKTPGSNDGRRRVSGYQSAPPDNRRYQDNGPPRYIDGNPYGTTNAIAPPPVGYYDDRR